VHQYVTPEKASRMVTGSLEAFIDVLRQLREPLMIATRGGEVVFANIACAEELGTSIDALEGASLASYAPHPADVAACLAGPATFPPFPLRSRDGRRLVCEAKLLDPGTWLLRLAGPREVPFRTHELFGTLSQPHSLAANTETISVEQLTDALLMHEPPRRSESGENATTRLARLHVFTQALARAITPVEVTEAIVDAGLVAVSARNCGLWLLSRDGATICLARSIGDGAPRPDSLVAISIDQRGGTPILDAIVSGAPIWLESSCDLEARYPAMAQAFRAGGETALAFVPLSAHGRCIGALAFNFDGVRRFIDDERTFIQIVCWHSAQAIERARLYAAERHAREEADASRRRSEFLADASKLLTASLDYASTLARVAEAAVPRVADWCIVELEEERLRGAPAVAAHIDPAKLPFVLEASRRYRESGDSERGIPGAIRTGKAQLYRHFSVDLLRAEGAVDAELAAVFEQTGLVSSMVVPIAARGHTLGAIVLNSADPARLYDERDLAMAEELGRRAGLAVDNARLYRDAREADRLKDEFLAMLSHELRNPLAPIVTTLQLMDQTGSQAFARERGLISRHLYQLVRLVDDLLDVARVTRGKITLRKERCEVAQLVHKALDLTSALIEDREQRLVVSVPDSGLVVDADPARMTQVITNLVGNAAKYSQPQAVIAVTATAEDAHAVIRVRDSGVGIAPELLAKVFEPFVQVDVAADGPRSGLGIGLTVVKSLIELHGGSVSAHSEGPQRGTEIVIRLPRVAGEAVAVPAQQPRRLATPIASDCRVLVVDDNRDAADVLAEALRALGCSTKIAHSGPSALDMFAEFKPHLALLDIGLPVMNGYELARRLRAAATCDMAIVAVTGYGLPNDVARAREAGFDEHVIKPVELDTLRAVLARHAPRSP
jgi:signal transduction histidine kinase/CheY-like chemotaxis protein